MITFKEVEHNFGLSVMVTSYRRMQAEDMKKTYICQLHHHDWIDAVEIRHANSMYPLYDKDKWYFTSVVLMVNS